MLLADVFELERIFGGGWRRADVLEGRDSVGSWISLPDYRPSHLVRVWNIKYFVLPMGWDNPDPGTLELAYDGEVRIFRLKNWLPRAWLAEYAVVVPGERGAYAKLLDPTFNPSAQIRRGVQSVAVARKVTGSHGVEGDEEHVTLVTRGRGLRRLG